MEKLSQNKSICFLPACLTSSYQPVFWAVRELWASGFSSLQVCPSAVDSPLGKNSEKWQL